MSEEFRLAFAENKQKAQKKLATLSILPVFLGLIRLVMLAKKI